MNDWWEAQLALQRHALEQAQAAVDAGARLIDAQEKTARAAEANARAAAAWMALWTAPW